MHSFVRRYVAVTLFLLSGLTIEAQAAFVGSADYYRVQVSCDNATPTGIFTAVPMNVGLALGGLSEALPVGTNDDDSGRGQYAAQQITDLCVGDCNGDNIVSINEIIIGVNVALGIEGVGSCDAFKNPMGDVNIAQLLKGVANLLNGCWGPPRDTPTSTPTDTVVIPTVSPIATATVVPTASPTLTISPTATTTSEATITPTATDTPVNMALTPVSFDPERRFGLGASQTSPLSVVVADVNGDGHPDLLTVNAAADVSNGVSVLLGDGHGDFAAAQTFSAGNGPATIAVADLNTDGHLDLVIGGSDSSSNHVSVLLGHGDASFSDRQDYPVGNGFTFAIAIDLNGDGHPDVVTANDGSNDVSILLGEGDGTFDFTRTFSVGISPASVAAADFNGDGHPDLATANAGSNDVSMLLGNGDGTVTAAQNIEAGNDPRSIAAADLNGDGHQDLVVANFVSDGVSVLLDLGDGAFAAAQAFSVGERTRPNAVAVGDLNGDGRPDLVTANARSNDVSVLLGKGDGTFADPQMFAVGITPVSVSVADLNGDGRPDLVVANGLSSDLSVLIARP